MRKKAQIWISAVLYILIVSVAMVLILQAGLPLLNNMRDRASYTRAKDTMVGIDKQIIDVASEGEGSQRIIPIEIKQGELIFDDDNNNMRWQLSTKTKVIEPRSKIELGNIDVFTNVDVNTLDAVECFPDSETECYLLENSRIRVKLLKVLQGDPKTSTSTEELIQEIEFIDSGEKMTDNIEFGVNGAGNSGKWYTELSPSGNNTDIDKASVTLHMIDTGTTPKKYDLKITLESEADFIKTELNVIEY
ncbi:MAG: hypothetical protein ABII01_00045 [Candidatus Woesearchaeota archaeon]